MSARWHATLGCNNLTSMSRKPSSKKRVPPKTYVPTEEELQAIQTLRERQRACTPAPGIKMEVDEETRAITISFDHKDETTAQVLAMRETGTGDVRFFFGLLKQIAALGEQGRLASEDATDFALSVIGAVEPRDELEAMLAAQMAATHQATMMMARRLNQSETLQQTDAAERAMNKLSRTYTAQMETQKRYRSKAQQVVRVERVNVEDGGQAIVGSVHHEGGGSGET